MHSWIGLIKSMVSSFEDLKKAAEYNEEEERKYWIARMGKQTAMDVYTTGK